MATQQSTSAGAAAAAHTRTELAALYRLFVHYGWTDLTYTHISARDPGHPEGYLINAYGLLFEEVSASNLLSVGFGGELRGTGRYNRAGHAIHSTILQARPDINFILHSHTTAGVAVSAMKCGLLPLSQQANAMLGNIAYHPYAVAEEDPQECARLAASLGKNYLLVLHNHGLLTCGRSAGEAFLYHYFLQSACEIQLAALSSPGGCHITATDAAQSLSAWGAPRTRPWGGTQWQALLRLLDRSDPGYRD